LGVGDLQFVQRIPPCQCGVKPKVNTLPTHFLVCTCSPCMFCTNQAAILRFHGREWNGRAIKVEPIVDHPRGGRVRVPEKIVSYVSGEAKYTRDGKVNTMRRIAQTKTQYEQQQNRLRQQHLAKKRKKRAEQGQAQQLQQNIPRPTSTTKLVAKLSPSCQEEFLRASRKGYVSLPSTGFRRGRKSSSLACAHRQWCDDRQVPQIVLCKASGGRPLDNVIVDLSPLRIPKAMMATSSSSSSSPGVSYDFLLMWKLQIMTAATNADMVLRTDYLQDNCEVVSALEDDSYDEEDDDDEYQDEETVLLSSGDEEEIDDEEPLDGDTLDPPFSSSGYVLTLTEEFTALSSRTSINKLPVLSMGVFEGERSKAKAMAKELALLWDIPQEPTEELQEAMNQLISLNPTKSKNNNNGSNNSRRDADGNLQRKRENNPYRNGGRSQRPKQRRNSNDLDMYNSKY
jgi:hypothetical protein